METNEVHSEIEKVFSTAKSKKVLEAIVQIFYDKGLLISEIVYTDKETKEPKILFVRKEDAGKYFNEV